MLSAMPPNNTKLRMLYMTQVGKQLGLGLVTVTVQLRVSVRQQCLSSVRRLVGTLQYELIKFGCRITKQSTQITDKFVDETPSWHLCNITRTAFFTLEKIILKILALTTRGCCCIYFGQQNMENSTKLLYDSMGAAIGKCNPSFPKSRHNWQLLIPS